MIKYKDYIVESFRRGYCERYIIQSSNWQGLTERIAEKNLIIDVNCYIAIP